MVRKNIRWKDGLGWNGRRELMEAKSGMEGWDW
jgi:hypothetical protein